MNTLKHDLSFNETKVSFDRLIETALIATHHAKVACERDLGELQNSTFNKDYRAAAYAAEHLATHAADLALAVDTLDVLTESKSREVFTIIGKPPVQGESISK